MIPDRTPAAREVLIPLVTSHIGMVSMSAAVHCVPVCLTAIGATFRLGEGAMGSVPGALFAGVVMGLCLAGPLSDRFGMKPFLLLGAGCQAVGMLLLAAAPEYWHLLSAIWLTGLGKGAVDALLSPLVCTLRPHRRTSAMNFLHSFYFIGAAFTIAAGMLLLRLGGTWRGIILVAASPSILTILGLGASKLPSAAVGRDTHVRFPRLLRDWRFLMMLLAMLLCGGTEHGPVQWSPAYVERALGWERRNAGLGLLVFSLLMATGRMASARLARHVAASAMVMISAVASSLLILVMAQPYGAVAAVVASSLLGVAVSALWPSTLAYAADRYPNGGATMFSALAAAGSAAGIVFPPATGLISQRYGMHWGIASLAIAPLLLLLTFRVLSHGRQPAEVLRSA